MANLEPAFWRGLAAIAALSAGQPDFFLGGFALNIADRRRIASSNFMSSLSPSRFAGCFFVLTGAM
jgi:hypothetical protein